ncbi:cadmium transporter [Planosporangium thailandense]|uniref:Cadmium transporter n=2 Tax=Planosporangium thailandense TaxID=765197 RepID=A0ABX0XZG4_9ACTN|nr:cadmium resistance transporter [Planosporangium thailandense]NJC71461.1 cadmium transporter [Planosporangium thailandense]
MTTAAGLFAGTNIDDFVVVTVLFLASKANGQPRPWQIWVGQYAGIALVVVVSAVAALGLGLVPDRWVGLLGVIPFGLGVRGLAMAVRGRNGHGQPSPAAAGGLGSVTGITLATSADNLSVYTPMFHAMNRGAGVVAVGAFAVLVAMWCAAGRWLGSYPPAVALAGRSARWLVPGVYLTIGTLLVARAAAATYPQ